MFVKGTDFLLEGGREHAAPRLLGRDAGADRRGRHPPGRRGALARRRRLIRERHHYGTGRSQFGELFLPDGDGPVPGRRGDPRRVLARALRAQADAPAVRATSSRAAGPRGTSSTGGSGASAAAAGRPRSTTSRAGIDHLRGAPHRARWTSTAWWRSATRPAGTSPRGRRAPGLPGRAGRRRACAGAVSQAGVVDLRLAWELAALERRRAASCSAARPRSVPERYARGLARRRGCRSACPLLLTHGGRDDIVPPAMSERFAAAARAAGDDVRARGARRTRTTSGTSTRRTRCGRRWCEWLA